MSSARSSGCATKGRGRTANGRQESDDQYAEEIAAALCRSVEGSSSAAKVVASWTGANEKTVKNWLSGTYGPSGAHLVALARHSDEVLATFLALAGRRHLMAALNLAAMEKAAEKLLQATRQLRANESLDSAGDQVCED